MESLSIKNEIDAKYRPRITDARLKKLLETFGGVEITGPKWCGKTWTAIKHSNSAESLTEESAIERAKLDPGLALDGDSPRLIDEWQEVPGIWDATRNLIDARANRPGQFILTGSTQPKDISKIRHSGAGRFARLRMYPMTLSESIDGAGGVSFAGLFDQEFASARFSTSLADVAAWCCRGGWPAALGKSDEGATEIANEYVHSITQVSAPRAGHNPNTATNLLRSLALNTAQPVTDATLLRDMGAGNSVSLPTLKTYLDFFAGLFMTEDLPGYGLQLRDKGRVRVKPKRYFTDPSLASAIQGATPERLLRDTQTLGNLFETLVLRDLRVFLTSISGVGNTIGYYRDNSGLECDFVVQLADGRWGVIEAKLSENTIDDQAVKRLNRVVRAIAGNQATRVGEPSFRAFVVGKSEVAYRRKDGILVIPAATLSA